MTTQQLLSDPILQRAFQGLACGLLLGFAHRFSRRLLEAGSFLAAITLIFLIFSGRAGVVQQFDFAVIQSFLMKWNYQLAGALVGTIIGYSIVERKSKGGE